MLESYKWMGWKSLQALILRASLCGANNVAPPHLSTSYDENYNDDSHDDNDDNDIEDHHSFVDFLKLFV